MESKKEEPGRNARGENGKHAEQSSEPFSAQKTPSEEQISALLNAADDPVALMQPERQASKAFAIVVEQCVAVVEYMHALLKEYAPQDGEFNADQLAADMQEKPHLFKFCNFALPVIVECALRRKCPREYAPLVAKFARCTAALLSELIPYDRLFPTSMQLLYVLFDGMYAAGSFVRAATPLAAGAAASSPTASGAPSHVLVFYNQHGRPNVMYKDKLPVYFWPDEEEWHLGKEKAIGHHVFFYNTDKADWWEGDVIAYDSSTGSHVVQLPLQAPQQEHEHEQPEAHASSQQSRQVHINLQEVQHFWADRRHAGTSAVLNNSNDLELTFSEEDIGAVVKVFWPYYSKNYRGRITDYLPDQRKHVISYDDGDVRTYDMNRKQFQVVSLGGLQAQDPSASVQPSTAQQANGEEPMALRPPASSGFWISEHLCAVINTFATTGGFNRVFQRLVDVSQPAPGPSFIATYLRLLSQLRPRVQAAALRHCVWEAKESIPAAMLRFSDHQLKDLTQERITEILENLHDLIAVSEGSAAPVSIQETINRLHLQLSLKMLRCSQLQKRVQALTYIRWVIEMISPTVVAYLRNRPMKPQETRAVGRPAAQVTAQFDRRKQVVLTAQYMEDWLVENQVVELLFGESMHTELVPRCDVILLFLALRGALQQRQIAQIWRSCVDSHEAVARVVHPLILDLARTLSPSLRLFLFHEISALPFAKYSEQTLRLVKDYTVIALSASRRELASGTVRNDGIVHPQVTELGRDALESSSAKKGQVVNLPQRQWLGFGLLWQFIQDPVAPQTTAAASQSAGLDGASSYVNHALIDIAVDLMVELLAEEEFRDEREMLIERCIENVAAHKSAPASLMLLRKSISSISPNHRSWFGGRKGSATAATVLENLQKSSDLLGVFFSDLQFYHRAFAATVQTVTSPDKPSVDTTQASELLNERRIRINGASSRHPHIRQVQERLEFLIYVLNASSLSLNDEQAAILWTCGVEQAATPETAAAVLTWFDQMLTLDDKQLRKFLDSVQYTIALSAGAQKALLGTPDSSLSRASDAKLFATGVLANLFESRIVEYAKHVVSAASARLCVKLFLHLALTHKIIRLDDDGLWSVQQAIPLRAIGILWRIAVEAQDEAIAEAVIALLVELHHRISSKLQQRASDIRGAFIQRCLVKLSLNLQSLKGDVGLEGDERASEDTHSAASVPPQGQTLQATVMDNNSAVPPARMELTARRVTRYVRLVQQFVHRFGDDPNQRVLVQLKFARDGPVIAEVKLKMSDTIGAIRHAAMEYFAEGPEAIVLLRSVQSRIGMGSQELLSHDEKTLREEKFGVSTTVLIRRKEQAPSADSKAAPAMSPEQAALRKAKPELIQPADLIKGFKEATRTLSWLVMDDALSISQNESLDDMNFFLHAVAAAPTAPLPHKPDMMLDPKLVQAGEHSKSKSDIEFRRLVEAIGPYLASKPELFDQLFSMLDGALSTEIQGVAGFDVSSAVWEVMQRFPTQSTLLEQLRTLRLPEGGHFRQLFDTASLYKLVYSLQIIDAFLTSSTSRNSAVVQTWASRFMYLGGCEHLVNAFRTQLAALHEHMPREHQPSTTESSRFEVYVLSLTLLCRVLHSFLLFDPLYAVQQPQQMVPSLYGSEHHRRNASQREEVQPNGDARETIGKGVIMSLVDVNFLLQDGLQALLTMSSASAAISQSAFASFVEHACILMTGCVNAVDDGWQRLASCQHWGKWVRVFCVRHPSQAVRAAACRRLFVAACSQASNDARTFLLQSTLCACHPDLAGRFGVDLSVSRVASAASLTELGQQSNASPSDGHKLMAERNAAGPRGPVSKKQLRDGAQAYSLIALLLGMQLFPEFILKGSSRTSGTDGAEEDDVVLFSSSGFTLDDLCEIFVGLFTSHKATESIHASEPDSTLIGLFRVLLTLMHGSKRRQRMICTGKRHADDATPPKVMQFVYYKCLFPAGSDEDAALELTAATSVGSEDAQPTVQHGALCKTHQTRFLAYAMLFEFVNSNEANLARLVTEMLQWSTKFGHYSGRLLEGASPHESDNSESHKHEMALQLATERARLLWEYDPYSMMKDAGDYVGLVNQGATCYMNSTLQQLFHNSSFRNNLLGIEDRADALSDSVLFQLQVLFGHLKTTQKRFYDTLPLCRSFTDYDGQPISLVEQKDANEFCSMLFDKLESADPKANELVKKSFGGMLAWQVVSTESNYRSERLEPFYVITADVKGKRNLEESLELLVASELLTGDNKVLDPELEKKVEASRRCAIQELPDALIIHMKRFQFDVETLTRTKVNDYCSFPLSLDMFPYTVEGLARREARMRSMSRAYLLDSKTAEGDDLEREEQVDLELEPLEHSDGEESLSEEKTGHHKSSAPERHSTRPDSYYQYELTGIVAHFGTADSGHYYSFIKDKDGGRWLEFNDRVVVPFSEDQIEAECFGGTEKVSTNMGTVNREKMNSAYLLFYSRVEPYATVNTAPEGPTTSLSPVRTLSEDVDGDDISTYPGAGHAISKQVLHAVWNENVDFLRDLHLFDKVHFRFMFNLMTAPVLFGVDLNTQTTADSQASIESHALETWRGSAQSVPTAASLATQQRIAMLSLQFAIEVLTRARAGSCIPIWFDRLEQMVLADASGQVAEAILDELAVTHTVTLQPRLESRVQSQTTAVVVHPWLKQMFVQCPSSVTVRHMEKLLLACVHTAAGGAAQLTLRKFLDAMLTLLETYPLAEAPIRAGLQVVGEFLYKAASASFRLRMLLVDLGALDRIVFAWLRIRGADLSGNIVHDMVNLVDAVCMLVRSLQVAAGEEYEAEVARQMPTVQPTAPPLTVSPTTLTDESGQPSSEVLLPRDLFAFFNRIFVEDAIFVASQSFSLAVCHVVQGMGVCNTTLQFYGELAEKAIDCTTVKGFTTTTYRSYMRVLAELLMTQAVSANGILFMEQCIPQLLDRAERLALRQAKNDSEFVYSVSKLMLRFGMTSPEAYQAIKGMMKNVRQVRMTFLREAPRSNQR